MFHLFSIQTKSKEQLVNIDIEHKVDHHFILFQWGSGIIQVPP